MSQAPRPQTSAPPVVLRSPRTAGCRATGTVSRWPAMTTRSGRPSSVRATTTLPSRITSRCAYAAQGRLDLVGDLRLVAAHRLDVDQGRAAARPGRRPDPAALSRRAPYRLPGSARRATDPGRADRARRSCDRTAWGWGLATVHDAAGVLDTYFPAPALGSPVDRGRRAGRAGRGAAQRRAARRADRGACGRDRPGRPAGRHRRTRTCGCTCSATGWPRRARSTWTASSACCPTWCGPRWARARSTASSPSGPGCGPGTATVTVYGVDKFPRMVDYVLPSGVRIADADRVRLGAHLAAGTTVMHEGFVNFNAGTLGTLDGRGPDLRRRGGRPRLRRRRRRLDHGHAVRRRHSR